MSAREVAAGVRTGRFSSVEAVTSALARIAATNPQVNAIVELDADAALAGAAAADRRLRDGSPVGRLHGVPVTFKLNTNLEGLATTAGVADYTANVAVATDPQAASWLRAGAINLGRTNTPAFAIGWTSENDLHGMTANPWDLERTPGGSSGGAAAAVATGMCALAQGADTAGSIRYPAACCGVVGLRPTKGRVPGWAGPHTRDPSLATQEYVVPGPLARRVDDLRLGLAAMQEPDPRDPSTPPLPRIGEDGPATGQRPLKVAMVTDPGGAGLAGGTRPDVVEATRLAGAWLRDAGYVVEEVSLPELGEAASLWWRLALAELALGLRAEVQRVGSEHSKVFFELMFAVHEQEFGTVGLPDFLAGQARSGALRRRISEFMVDYPLLLTPVAGESPFRMGEDIESVERVAEMMAMSWPAMAVPVLRLPALGLAATRGTGAPIGVQLVGRPYCEDLVLEVGEVIEARSGVVTPVDPASPS